MVASRTIATSIPDLAVRTGLSESTLYALANAGQLPGCRRVGRRFIVHIETINTWLQAGSGDEPQEGENPARRQ